MILPAGRRRTECEVYLPGCQAIEFLPHVVGFVAVMFSRSPTESIQLLATHGNNAMKQELAGSLVLRVTYQVPNTNKEIELSSWRKTV